MLRTLAACALCLTVAIGSPADAGTPPIPAGSAIYEFDNTFEVTLAQETDFNPNPFPITVPAVASGVFSQVWEAQVGDAILDELPSIVEPGELIFSGLDPLAPPVPFTILGGAEEVPAVLGPFTGSITSIEQDPSGSLTGGTRVVGGAFGQVVPTPLGDAYLYSIDPYVFEGSITGLPFPVGTVFTGTAGSTVDIRLALGGPDAIDPNTDPVIGQVLGGGVITITGIVPEPASAAMASLLSALCVAGRRRSV